MQSIGGKEVERPEEEYALLKLSVKGRAYWQTSFLFSRGLMSAETAER